MISPTPTPLLHPPLFTTLPSKPPSRSPSPHSRLYSVTEARTNDRREGKERREREGRATRFHVSVTGLPVNRCRAPETRARCACRAAAAAGGRLGCITALPAQAREKDGRRRRKREGEPASGWPHSRGFVLPKTDKRTQSPGSEIYRQGGWVGVVGGEVLRASKARSRCQTS